MQENSYGEFVTECKNITDKYLGICQKNYSKKKDYNFIAKTTMKNWFEEYMPVMTTLDILKQFTASLKENKKEYTKCSEEEKLLINFVIDNLECICLLNNSILDIAYKVILKL